MASSQDEIPTPSRAKAPLASQKLDRTLKELESAFNDWEALGLATLEKVDTAAAEPPETGDKEFRTKTKKLLNQLREQLSELGE